MTETTNRMLTPAPAPVPPMNESQLFQSALLNFAPQADPSVGPPGVSGAPTLSALTQALRRRWKLAFSLAGLAAAATIVAVFIAMPPKYIAETFFSVSSFPDRGPFDQTNQVPTEFPVYKASQLANVTSMSVVSEALKEKASNGREVRDLSLVRDLGVNAIPYIAKHLKGDYNLGPETLRVIFGTDNPEEAADILNAIGAAYLNKIENETKEARDAQIRGYEEKRSQYEEELRRLRGMLNRKIETSEATSKEMQSQKLIQAGIELNNARALLRQKNSEREGAKSKVIALETSLKLLPSDTIPDDKMPDLLKDDPISAGYLKQIQTCQESIQRYNEVLKNPEPYVRIEQDRIRDYERKLAQRNEVIMPELEARYRQKAGRDIARQIALAKADVDAYGQQIKSLTNEVVQLDIEYQKLAPQNMVEPIDVQVLRDKIKNLEDTNSEVAKKINLQKLDSPRSRVTLLQKALPPSGKGLSRQIKIAGAGSMAMFGLVLFGIAFWEFRTRKISIAEDIQQGLGINVVGALPAIPMQVRQPLATGATTKDLVWQNQLNESVDAVRTLLLHSARADGTRVVMVTSANSGEGKTSLASQLATSLARSWRKTLLIDGDLRHPAAHKLFDVPSEPGLSEVLRGEVQLGDAVRSTPFSRLWMLPAGNWDNHAIQALAQDNFKAVLDEVRQQYDFIIVDSPPVLPVTDSLLLGQHVDGVLFAILRDVSRAPAVHAAQQKLAPLGIKTLGAVMIGTKAELGSDYQYVLAKSNVGTAPQ